MSETYKVATFLIQHLSMAVQWGNANSISGAIPELAEQSMIFIFSALDPRYHLMPVAIETLVF